MISLELVATGDANLKSRNAEWRAKTRTGIKRYPTPSTKCLDTLRHMEANREWRRLCHSFLSNYNYWKIVPVQLVSVPCFGYCGSLFFLCLCRSNNCSLCISTISVAAFNADWPLCLGMKVSDDEASCSGFFHLTFILVPALMTAQFVWRSTTGTNVLVQPLQLLSVTSTCSLWQSQSSLSVREWTVILLMQGT